MITRVLHVVPDLIPYGLERVVAALASLADRRRFEVSVASLYADAPGSLRPELESRGVRVFHLNKRRGFDPRMFWRFSRVIRKLRPDIVHTHNYVLRYTVPATLWAKTPLLVHTIHSLADREVDSTGRWLQRRVFRGAVKPVAIAGEVAASFERVYGLARPPLIPNGIPVSRYAGSREARAAWRAAEGFSPNDLLFACVARFAPAKNHGTLLEAFARGPAKLPHARLLLAGDGDLRPAFEQQARQLGIEDHVRFLGRRQDVPQLLAAADVFALASVWEGNPLSVMEAMAAGLPAVVTAVGGVPELVQSGRHGFVVPPGDATAFSAAMMQLANEPERRHSMGRAAAGYALEHFDEKRMVEKYESLYDALLARLVPGGLHACTAH